VSDFKANPYRTSGEVIDGLSVNPIIAELPLLLFKAQRTFRKIPVFVDTFGATVSFEYAPAKLFALSTFFIAYLPIVDVVTVAFGAVKRGILKLRVCPGLSEGPVGPVEPGIPINPAFPAEMSLSSRGCYDCTSSTNACTFSSAWIAVGAMPRLPTRGKQVQQCPARAKQHTPRWGGRTRWMRLPKNRARGRKKQWADAARARS
jgi:hypothetical protein